MTCKICGHEHGLDTGHVTRTIDGSTADFVERIAQGPDMTASELEERISEPANTPLGRALTEQPVTDIVDRVLRIIGNSS